MLCSLDGEKLALRAKSRFLYSHFIEGKTPVAVVGSQGKGLETLRAGLKGGQAGLCSLGWGWREDLFSTQITSGEFGEPSVEGV